MIDTLVLVWNSMTVDERKRVLLWYYDAEITADRYKLKHFVALNSGFKRFFQGKVVALALAVFR